MNINEMTIGQAKEPSEMMNKFKFNIVFMKSAKCCDFGGEVVEVSEEDAKSSAREWAKMNGFNGAVKKVTVKKVTA